MFYDKSVLDNGVTVVTERMDAVRSAALGMWVRVGSRDEAADEHGMSHFMEHMLFKGTSTRSAVDISTAFDALGAELNAFTSREYTCFYARMVDEHLEKGFEILADMVVNASLAQSDIEPEREVVIEEIARSEDQPDDLVYDLLADGMLSGHPLGHPVLGTRQSVSSFDTRAMRRYHGQHYRSGNLTVVACGSVDHAQLVALAERYLGSMPVGERTQRAGSGFAQRSELTCVPKETEQAHVLIGYPSVSFDDERRYARALLDMVLGGGMSSRLFLKIREEMGLAYSVYTHSQQYEDLGMFSMYAGTRPDNLVKVVATARAEFERMAAEGVAPEELDRVKELACGNFVLRMESTNAHMTRLGRLATCGTEITSIDEMVDKYRSVTKEEVDAAARELLGQVPSIAVVSPYSRDELGSALLG